ncbi:MAG TPA: glycosyltransferase family 9 protein [Oscillatoriaceae cyanobacterium]
MRLLVDHGGQKGLGDIVCETNFYAALRAAHPRAAIASRGSRGLAWGNPHVDAFDETSPDRDFDRVIRPGSAIASYAGLPESLAARRTIFDHLARRAGVEPLGRPPELFVLPEELENFELRGWGEAPLIAYSADSVEQYRRWGEERFAELMARIAEHSGARLVELGSGVTAGHLGIGEDRVGRTTLRESMAILWQADLFIGNHGGLTHLAGGVGTPILSPWGASHPFWAYAYDDLSVALESELPCRHCHWTERALPECVAADKLTGRTACTQRITVDAMAAAFEAQWPRLLAEREAIRARKRARTARAVAPGALQRFESAGFDANAFIQLHIGGAPADWGEAHRIDHFARLKKIVLFPEWEKPENWQPVLATFVDSFEAAAPWVLVVAAGALRAPEAIERLRKALEGRRLTRPLPKILLLAGTFTPEAKRALCAAAELVA